MQNDDHADAPSGARFGLDGSNVFLLTVSETHRIIDRPSDRVIHGAWRKKALEGIESYGCHVIHVLEERDEPPFSYSVGVQKTSASPEVIVIGLKRPIAHFVINEYNQRVRAGERFVPGAQYMGFLEGFPVQFERVSKKYFDEYLGWNKWLYRGSDFDVLQIVYPDTDDIWPWDSLSTWFRRRQPILNGL